MSSADSETKRKKKKSKKTKKQVRYERHESHLIPALVHREKALWAEGRTSGRTDGRNDGETDALCFYSRRLRFEVPLMNKHFARFGVHPVVQLFS